MLKKVVGILLSLVILCGLLTGCGDDSQVQQPSSGSTYNSIISATSDVESEKNQSPDFIQNLRDKLNDLAENNKVAIKAGPIKKGQYGGYEFSIVPDNDDSKKLKVWYQSVDFNPENKSFQISFDLPEDNTVIKEVVTLLLVSMDSSLGFEDANNKMQEFVNTFSSDKFSDVIECGDFLLLIAPGDGFLSPSFSAIDKTHMWKDINPSEYDPVDYEIYEAAEMNSGTKVSLKGTVISWTTDDPTEIAPFAYMMVRGENGEQYNVVYSYQYTPVSFDPGDDVIVYGTVSYNKSLSSSQIQADKIEIK